jgi:hypothetical protein
MHRRELRQLRFLGSAGYQPAGLGSLLRPEISVRTSEFVREDALDRIAGK